MPALRKHRLIAPTVLAGTVVAAALAWQPAQSRAVDASPFEKLIGRWVGEGRLGLRDSATEQVKCRVTYLLPNPTEALQQTIRCASASGSIEVRSMVSQAQGVLSGTWTELTRNMHGDLTGTVTPRGFKVSVKGEGLHANMDIATLGAKQVIEIQFIDSSLIGLTLVLEKG